LVAGGGSPPPDPQVLAFTEAYDDLDRLMDVGTGALRVLRSAEFTYRWPDFLVIGAQKAGTTWLHDNLNWHPEVWLPPIKELNYFNEKYFPSATAWESEGRRDQAANARQFYATLEHVPEKTKTKQAALEVIERNERTDDWYAEIFSHAGDDAICGEISPDYCLLPRSAIARIVTRNPGIKVVLMMRDPVERAWSNIAMTAAREGRGTDDVLCSPGYWKLFRGRSNYPAMIRRWSNLALPGRFRAFSFDEVATDPLGLLRRICGHLGIVFDPRFFPSAARPVAVGASSEIPADVYNFMKSEMADIYTALVEAEPLICHDWVQKHYKDGLPRSPGPSRGRDVGEEICS
jgi:hypothetical protein